MKCLSEMNLEDANEHGRLLAMKEKLLDLGDILEEKQRRSYEVLFHASDFKSIFNNGQDMQRE